MLSHWRVAAARWWPGAAALIVLCLAVYLPGFASIPPVDRDECRFAQASRQMFEAAALPPERLDTRTEAGGRPVGLHAGGWLIPMVQDRPRLNKPPLIYWLQAGSARALSANDPTADAMWMYRLPSLLSAVAAVLLTWRLGLRLFDPRAAWLGAALLAICPMVVWDAHQARADQLLLAATTGAMVCLHGAVRSGSIPSALAFWALVGVGVMAKGFITPLVAGGAVCVLLLVSDDRRRLLERLRPMEGALILAAVVVPWVALVAARIGWGEYLALVWDETFRRAAAGSREGHFAPPGTHVLLLGGLFWPGCLGAVFGFARAVRIGLPKRDASAGRWSLRRRAGRGGELFLLAWIVPAWIVFELSLAKLPHYTLPMYPAVALLCARAVLSGAFARESGWLHRLGVLVWWGAPIVLGLALAAVGVAGVFREHLGVAPYLHAVPDYAGWLMLACGLSAVAVALVGAPARTGRWAPRSQAASVLAAVLVTAPVLQWVAPVLVPGARTAAVMQIVGTVPRAGGRPIASTYPEDSMVFATRGRVVRLAPERIGEFLAAHPDAVIIREGRDEGDDGRIDGLPLVGSTRGDPWHGRRPLGVSAAP